MCTNKKTMARAISNFNESLRGLNATDKRAIFVRNESNKLDLVGFFVVMNRTEAIMQDVHRGGEVTFYRTIPTYNGMGEKRIARDFGVPGAIVVRI